MNSKRFLKIKADSLKRCGVVRMLVKRKLKKRHLQHHVVFQRNKKVFQTHVFAVEKKQKNLCIGQKLIKKVKLYEAVYHRFIQFFYVERSAFSISALICSGLTRSEERRVV